MRALAAPVARVDRPTLRRHDAWGRRARPGRADEGLARVASAVRARRRVDDAQADLVRTGAAAHEPRYISRITVQDQKHVLDISAERDGAVEQLSDERFDRAEFTRRALDLVGPRRTTVAICRPLPLPGHSILVLFYNQASVLFGKFTKTE